jgi:DNA invertase Pin-like site-specific DNA recombinase
VENEGWKDVNVSGRNFDRPGLTRLFEAVEAGEINAVAVGYLSRFGRNTHELLENVQRLRGLKATLYIGKERLVIRPDDEDPITRLILTILAAVAELEGARLREQLGRANRTAATNGVSIQVPFGYRRSNGAGSKLEPDDDPKGMPEGWTPAKVVRWMFERRALGVGDSALARELNAAGIPTATALEHARGRREAPGSLLWKHNTVINVIECHTYRGVIPRGVEFVGEGKKRRAISWEFLPGDHDALVDADLWERAQRRPAPAIRNGSTAGGLLVGLVRCGHCSQTMRPNKSNGSLVYRCRGRRAGCAEPAGITRERLDEYVVTTLLARNDEAEITPTGIDAKLREAERAAEEAAAELAAFDRHAKAAEYGDGFNAARRFRLAARDDAELVLARLKATTSKRRAIDVGFRDLPLDEQRETLAELLDAVVVWRAADKTRAVRRDIPARTALIGAGRAPFELSRTGRVVAPRPWPRA